MRWLSAVIAIVVLSALVPGSLPTVEAQTPPDCEVPAGWAGSAYDEIDGEMGDWRLAEVTIEETVFVAFRTAVTYPISSPFAAWNTGSRTMMTGGLLQAGEPLVRFAGWAAGDGYQANGPVGEIEVLEQTPQACEGYIHSVAGILEPGTYTYVSGAVSDQSGDTATAVPSEIATTTSQGDALRVSEAELDCPADTNHRLRAAGHTSQMLVDCRTSITTGGAAFYAVHFGSTRNQTHIVELDTPSGQTRDNAVSLVDGYREAGGTWDLRVPVYLTPLTDPYGLVPPMHEALDPPEQEAGIFGVFLDVPREKLSS